MRAALKMDTDGTLTELDLDVMEGSLKVLQTAVGGYIEAIDLTPKLTMYGNEEAKLIGMEPNRAATAWFRKVYRGTPDYIAGPVVFTGGINDQGETMGLSEDSIKAIRYSVS